ncbi:hypothetical protein BKA93DRAFT_750181 [Sparassis latifolia]
MPSNTKRTLSLHVRTNKAIQTVKSLSPIQTFSPKPRAATFTPSAKDADIKNSVQQEFFSKFEKILPSMCRNEAPFQQFISQCIQDIGSTSTEPAYEDVAIASGSNKTGNPKSLLEMLLELEKKKKTVEKSLESIGNDVKEGRTLHLADFANADEEWLSSPHTHYPVNERFMVYRCN